MIEIMPGDTDLLKKVRDGGIVVMYGTGAFARILYPFLPGIKYVCDARAAEESYMFNGIKVIPPAELAAIGGLLHIIVCVKREVYIKEIIETLSGMSLNAHVYIAMDMKCFNLYHPTIMTKERDYPVGKVRIIHNFDGWILGKFATKLKEGLAKRGISAVISDCPDPEADINHYIIYSIYEPLMPHNDTLMITHIDSLEKLERVRFQLQYAKMGICMSEDTMEKLAGYGIPRGKLCFVNPAHDEQIRIRKTRVGITHRNYASLDHRKRVDALVDICKRLDGNYFRFVIMGAGWEDVVKQMQEICFEVDYYPEFNYEIYLDVLSNLDYYMFFGMDEGSMGFVDALAAGVPTIVTPQGYHLDVRDGITHACITLDDFASVLTEIQNERKKRVETVGAWTWDRYVEKHIDIWNYIVGYRKDLYRNQHVFRDGFASVLPDKI